MAMLGELSDVVTFTIALILMWAELSYTYTIIITSVMIIMKTISFVATFLDTLYTALDIIQARILSELSRLSISTQLQHNREIPEGYQLFP